MFGDCRHIVSYKEIPDPIRKQIIDDIRVKSRTNRPENFSFARSATNSLKPQAT
jgi:hypothetical protein